MKLISQPCSLVSTLIADVALIHRCKWGRKHLSPTIIRVYPIKLLTLYNYELKVIFHKEGFVKNDF